MVLEKSPFGERAYDIYSRLLRERIVLELVQELQEKAKGEKDNEKAAAILDASSELLKTI